MVGQRKPRVVVLTTGGTIASRPDPSGGVIAAAGGEELLSAVPGLEEVAEVRVEELFKIGGYLMKPENMLEVARRVRELDSDLDVAGFVVTHGTDTMEETAYLTDLLYAGNKPVVFTGAQRNAAEPDTDGPRNLRDAVRVAASPSAGGIGAVVVMGGSIEGSREATKVHTTDPRAFASPGYGPVGTVTDEGVYIFHPAYPAGEPGPGDREASSRGPRKAHSRRGRCFSAGSPRSWGRWHRRRSIWHRERQPRGSRRGARVGAKRRSRCGRVALSRGASVSRLRQRRGL